jgi:hypothetical protein
MSRTLALETEANRVVDRVQALDRVHQRPVQGVCGRYRVNLRHGVSRVRSGRRHTLGVIVRDAS